MTGKTLVHRLLGSRYRNGCKENDNRNTKAFPAKNAVESKPRKKSKKKRPSPVKVSPRSRARPGSGASDKRLDGCKSTGTPIIVPPWSYSLGEVRDKVRKRDGLRRRVVEDAGGLMMGDVEGLWDVSGDDAHSVGVRRFLPTDREEERLDRIFENKGLTGWTAEGPPEETTTGRQQNNPFGRGSYRAKKSMGEKRWEAYKRQEMQNSLDHVGILEERFGNRFVRECRKRVYSGMDNEEQTTNQKSNRKEPHGADGEARNHVPRLNLGVPVGQVTRKRPSTAEGLTKRPRIAVGGAGIRNGQDDDDDDGWRIVAGRPNSR